MAALDFRGLVINSLLLGLFFFGLLIIPISIAIENNAESTLLSDPATSSAFANLSETLTGVEDIATKQREGFESETPTIGTDSFLFDSIIGAGKTFSSSISVVGSIGLSFIMRSLGLNEGFGLVISSTFITIMTLLIILLAWKIYKTGF